MSTTSTILTREESTIPWQLKLFSRSLKKQQKLAALLKMLGRLDAQRCILVTCGDNNGALNWHFKQHGGHWSWADAEEESTVQIADLTGDPVMKIDKETPVLAAPDNYFDVVLTIDVHEHLPEPLLLNRELARIVKPNGRVITTTPGGDPRKLVNRLKKWLGMRASDYGHLVDGYDIRSLEAQLREVSLEPVANSSYSRFFTEMLEFVINFAYVKVLARRSRAKVEQGQIAPQNEAQLKAVEKTYKLYTLLYPFFWLASRFDYLLQFSTGYAVIVSAQKKS